MFYRCAPPPILLRVARMSHRAVLCLSLIVVSVLAGDAWLAQPSGDLWPIGRAISGAVFVGILFGVGRLKALPRSRR